MELIIDDAKVRRIWSQLLRNLLWFIYVVWCCAFGFTYATLFCLWV